MNRPIQPDSRKQSGGPAAGQGAVVGSGWLGFVTGMLALGGYFYFVVDPALRSLHDVPVLFLDGGLPSGAIRRPGGLLELLAIMAGLGIRGGWSGWQREAWELDWRGGWDSGLACGFLITVTVGCVGLVLAGARQGFAGRLVSMLASLPGRT
jgi:hypothetical protein